jgi:hypothetical protein
MKRPAGTPLFVLAGLVAMPGLARAACPPLAVEIDADVRTRWPQAPQQVLEAFQGRADIDACAVVQLTMSGQSIGVKVVLPDGRAATRAVAQRADVIPTLEALLLLPQPPVPLAEAAPASPPAVAAPAPSLAPAASVTAGRAAPLDEPSRLAIELSLGAGARIGDGQTGGGLGALSLVDLAGWLIGFEGRADVYEPIDGGVQTGAFELALLGGRRLRFGTRTLDLLAGPALLREGGSISVTQPARGDRPVIMEVPEENSPRLRLGARLNFRARSVLRTFVGLDGDLGARRERVDVAPFDLGQLPAWTVGLTVGATVGTL